MQVEVYVIQVKSAIHGVKGIKRNVQVYVN